MSTRSRLAELRKEAQVSEDEAEQGKNETTVEKSKPRRANGRENSRMDRDRNRKTRTGTNTGEAEEKSQGETELEAQMERYAAIRKGLDVIKSNASQIELLRTKNRQTSTEKSRRQIMSAMDEIMSSTNTYGHAIKKALDEINSDNKTFARQNPSSSLIQAHENLYQQHLKKFQASMNEYNQAAAGFKNDLQKRTRREVEIVDSELTEQEVTEIVENGRAQDVIKQALVSDNLQDVVRAIEERHQDILRLEAQVLEIYELFKDLSTLVDLQQDSLDVIENRIQSAARYTEKAEVELQEAEDYQRKARSRRCCILMIVVGILLVILLPTIAKTSGSF